jgi:hypothetical protein
LSRLEALTQAALTERIGLDDGLRVRDSLDVETVSLSVAALPEVAAEDDLAQAVAAAVYQVLTGGRDG